MSTIDVHKVRKFKDDVHHEMQQSKARLLPFCVDGGILNAQDAAIDSMGEVALAEVFGRHQAINEIVPEHKRRRLLPRRYAAAILIDTDDVHSVLMDPKKEYRKALTAAINRKIDEIIVTAAFASIVTGQQLSTTVTFAADGGLTVDASAGLTLAKLVEAIKNFTNYEINNEESQDVVFGFTGDEESTMLQLSTLTSGDFSRQFALEKGMFTNIVGMKALKFGDSVPSPILPVSGSVRDCLIMRKGAVEFAMKQDIEIVLEKLPERTQTWKLEAILNAGAVRKQGAMVQKFQTTIS